MVKSITATQGWDGDSGRSDVDAAAAAAIAMAGRRRKQGGRGRGSVRACGLLYWGTTGILWWIGSQVAGNSPRSRAQDAGEAACLAIRKQPRATAQDCARELWGTSG